MDALPNAAEAALAETIRRTGGAGFEASLGDFLRRSISCNNVVMIVFRRAAEPEVLYEQADDPVVFRDLHRVYWYPPDTRIRAGIPIGFDTCESGACAPEYPSPYRRRIAPGFCP